MKFITVCGSLRFQKEIMMISEKWSCKVIVLSHLFIRKHLNSVDLGDSV